MSDEQSREFELDRFWNELIEGSGINQETTLDSETIAAIQFFRSTVLATPPGSSRERMDREVAVAINRLNQSQIIRQDGRRESAHTYPWAEPDSSIGKKTGRFVPERKFTRYAIALFLLAAVAVGAYALEFDWVKRDEPRNTIPAVVVPVSASPSPVSPETETLLDVVLPAEMLPSDLAMQTALFHATLPGSERVSWSIEALRIEYVIAGSVAVTADGTTRIVRAGGVPELEVVFPGETINLGPGDAFFVEAGVLSEYINAGTSNVETLVWLALEPSMVTFALPPPWIEHHGFSRLRTTFPNESIRFTLEYVELDAKASLVGPTSGLFWGVIEPEDFANRSETDTLGDAGDSLRNPLDRKVTVTLVTLESDSTPPPESTP